MPGITFLFWNVNRKPLEARAARMANAHAVDVVVLAECVTSPGVVARALNAGRAGAFRYVSESGAKLKLFCRHPANLVRLDREPLDAWLAFRAVRPPLPELVVFACHLPSKQWTDEPDRMLTFNTLAADVRQVERREGHGRTVVVGDLNVNPFEVPVVWAGGLHGLMTRDLARREARDVRGREYPLFYNPMWGVFGDRTAGPGGTYYRSAAASVNSFWNACDQVLLRPAVMDQLGGLRVLDSDGSDTLLTPDGRPDATNGSDHLPLLFRLDW